MPRIPSRTLFFIYLPWPRYAAFLLSCLFARFLAFPDFLLPRTTFDCELPGFIVTQNTRLMFQLQLLLTLPEQLFCNAYSWLLNHRSGYSRPHFFLSNHHLPAVRCLMTDEGRLPASAECPFAASNLCFESPLCQ